MEPIEARRSLREQIARQVHTAVITGELRPGVVYSVPTLAERFGVSPTPVREAILDLAKDGLIGIVKNKGFRVTALSEAELDEISEVRALLEVPTVAALAGTLSPAQLATLRQLAVSIVDAARAGDLTAYLEADTAFHQALLGTRGNALLVDTVTALRDRTRLYGLGALAESKQLIHSAREHLELVDLLATGKPREVAKLMRRHLSHVRGIWAAPHGRGGLASAPPGPPPG